MELQVAVSPVERPNPLRLRVPQTGDQEAGPGEIVRTRTPRRSALEDRDRHRGHVDVDAILIQELRGVSLVRPLENPMDVCFGHHDREAISVLARQIGGYTGDPGRGSPV